MTRLARTWQRVHWKYLCCLRTYRPADSGRDGRQVMTGSTAVTSKSLSNWCRVSNRLGCRLPVLMHSLPLIVSGQKLLATNTAPSVPMESSEFQDLAKEALV